MDLAAPPTPIVRLVSKPFPSGEHLDPAPLPVPSTSFVGRRSERADLVAILARSPHRVVTLFGPGGVGKTRLALAVAGDLAREPLRIVAFAPLSGVIDPDRVVPAIAAALGVPESLERPLVDHLRIALAHQDVLLVLDTFEHLRPAVPALVELLDRCPTVRVLVTSRAVLAIGGERVVPLAPLTSGGDDEPGDAVRLFLDRAAAAGGGDIEGEIATVAAICDRLDGLPLAIEVVAARTRLFAPRDLLDLLGHGLPLLDIGPRDGPDRSRSLRGAINWSYALLSPAEQALFRRLSVFDGWTVPLLVGAGALFAVAGDSLSAGAAATLDALTALVDQSLVARFTGPDGSTRLALLDTVRGFAGDLLTVSGEHDTARGMHAEAVLAWAEPAKPLMFGPDQGRWLALADAERPNALAALGWAVERGNAALGHRLAAAILPIWTKRGRLREGRQWLEQVLALPGSAPPEARAACRTGCAMLCGALRDEAGAFRHAEAGLALAVEAGDALSEGNALMVLAGIRIYRDNDRDEADRLLAQAERRLRSLPGQPRLSGCVQMRADLAWFRGDFAGFARLAEESIEIARAAGDSWGVADALLLRADADRMAGRFGAASDTIRESVAIMREIDDPGLLAGALHYAALLAGSAQDHRLALRWTTAGGATYAAHGAPQPTGLGYLAWQELTDAAVAALGEDAAALVQAEGRALALADAVAEVAAYRPIPIATPPLPSRAPASPGALSPREREVLKLVAEGRSNREIADRLGISYHTARDHVLHILNKLGLPSRTAAATFAVRHDLA